MFKGGKTEGFTLLETVIAIGIFAFVGTAVFLSYSNLLDIFTASSFHNAALGIISAEIEMVRAMNYQDIGTLGGVPAGKLVQEKIVAVDGVPMKMATTVRSIDDPFDGVLEGTPNDTAPGDYKIVQFEVSCEQCRSFLPATMTTIVSPKNLENTTKNGALFITVLDASGKPLSGANVSVRNSSVIPEINLSDISDKNGMLQLVDIATSSGGYTISVTKNGYSKDGTWPLSDPENPNPIHPPATVVAQRKTDISFMIDRTGAFQLNTKDKFCAPVGQINFDMMGEKLIGQNPDVPKYASSSVTLADGTWRDATTEWDVYTLVNKDTEYAQMGNDTIDPLTFNPSDNKTINWVMDAVDPASILISIHDDAGQPLIDSTVTLEKIGTVLSMESGTSRIGHTDWTGGQYDSKSPGISTDVAGKLLLQSSGGVYPSQSYEWLVSKTFDMGTSDDDFTQVIFSSILPPETGADPLLIQVAANNDNSTWNFIGPDGTGATYFTTSGQNITAGVANNRYFRYKIFLRTMDQVSTPELSDINFVFQSACLIGHQAYFYDLQYGTYTLTIQRAGYQTFTDPNVAITEDWQSYKATLTP